MSVIAKFFVQSVEKTEGSSAAAKITLGAVCRGVENASWASATPAGNVTLWSLNDKATEYFEEGQEYEVLFTKAVKPQPGDGHRISPVTDKHGNTLCTTCGAYLDGDERWGWNDERREQAREQHREVYGN